MYVVTGATGHTGHATAKALLARGQRVRAIVRNADKAASLHAAGAEIVVSDLAEPTALAQALAGARGAYLMLPPVYSVPDVMAAARKAMEVLCQAVAASDVPHVAFLSSLGAERAEGTGIVRTLHAAEARLAATGRPATLLRAAYFMENWGAVLAPARDGVLPTALTLDRRFASVATTDIGEAAAAALLEPSPTAARVWEIVGPAEVSPHDVAAALSRALGKTVAPLAVPLAGFEQALRDAGFSADAAQAMRDLVDGLNAGRLAPGQAGAITIRGRITIDEAMRALAG